jgi:hypothetical protein
MRHLAVVLAVGAIALAGCDRDTPTAPDDGAQPQFATAQTVSISGKGTAEMEFFEQFAETYVSFQCPEGETATIVVHVQQEHANGTVTEGVGGIEEGCRDGPNSAAVTAAIIACSGPPCFFDVGRAHAVWTITTLSGSDTDEKNILIQAR